MTTEECAFIIKNKYSSLFILFYVFISIYKPFTANVISYINRKRNESLCDITSLNLIEIKDDVFSYVNNELIEYLNRNENIKEVIKYGRTN